MKKSQKRRYFAILAAGLAAFSLSACQGQSTEPAQQGYAAVSSEPFSAQKYLLSLQDSVFYDLNSDTLRFTIPDSALPEGNSLWLHISGQGAEMGEGSYTSFHLFETEETEKSWESGKTYEHSFGKDGMRQCEIEGAVIGPDGQRTDEMYLSVDGRNGVIGDGKTGWVSCVGKSAKTDHPGTLANVLTGELGIIDWYWRNLDALTIPMGDGVTEEDIQKAKEQAERLSNEVYQQSLSAFMTEKGFQDLLGNRILTCFLGVEPGAIPKSKTYEVSPLKIEQRSGETILTVQMDAVIDGTELSEKFLIYVVREDDNWKVDQIRFAD